MYTLATMQQDLRNIRRVRGLSQDQLSEQTGIRRATISELESGKRHTDNPDIIRRLASALTITEDMCAAALAGSTTTAAELKRMNKSSNETDHELNFRSAGWQFMAHLSRPLATALARELIVLWTHSSTHLEGNTISAGDTQDILTRGVTISGKPLLEHQEIHGHANALSYISQACTDGRLSLSDLHQLHRLIQTGVTVDIYAPIGKWKLEVNGTNTKQYGWHQYAAPAHVAPLMQEWLALFLDVQKQVRQMKPQRSQMKKFATYYAQLHIGFTRIHPYADGNGRLARILANIPLLVAGLPPLLIDESQRATYVGLLSDNDHALGPLEPGQPLFDDGVSFKKIVRFLVSSWSTTWDLIDRYTEQDPG